MRIIWYDPIKLLPDKRYSITEKKIAREAKQESSPQIVKKAVLTNNKTLDTFNEMNRHYSNIDTSEF